MRFVVLFNTTCPANPPKFIKNFEWLSRKCWAIEFRLWRWQLLFAVGDAADWWTEIHNEVRQ